ncbi:MAG TPA: SRPBCC family protein [Clostridia bacterium]
MLFSNYKIIKANLSDVYEFFSDTEKWEKAVPHCKSIDVMESTESSGIIEETIKMTVLAKGGQEEEFITKRWKAKDKVITNNQLTPPPTLFLHSGEWQFEKVDEGVKVTSVHLVFVNSSVFSMVQFKNSSFEDVEKMAKDSITHNSEQILEACEKIIAGR